MKRKSTFLKEVKLELDTIKKRATKEEIGKLNFEMFDSSSPSSCIYGQMTGCCTSVRAKELYPKKYSEIYRSGTVSLRKYIDDSLYVPFEIQDTETKGFFYTPLEKYLFMVQKPIHKELIQYLKGEIDTITLK